MDYCHPLTLFKLVESLRIFFSDRQFIETITPPIVENPGMEPHIHPFQLRSAFKQENLQLYLHTSPEFYMKKLLSEGFEKIYQIAYSFRDEPNSKTHRKQFLMLEWYRAFAHYDQIKKDVEELVSHCSESLAITTPTFQTVTVAELFQEYLNIEILNFLDPGELQDKILRDYSDLLSEKPQKLWPWEDYFFLLFLNKIEPQLKRFPFLLVDLFPSPLAALSKISTQDPRVCERFEVYMNGVEVANCFHELTKLSEQQERMEKDDKKKKSLYNYNLPTPNVLYHALEKGLPPSSGIALGVERLLMGLTGTSQKVFLD